MTFFVSGQYEKEKHYGNCNSNENCGKEKEEKQKEEKQEEECPQLEK